MFTGEYAHAMDAKNRVFVPKRLQEDLDLDSEGHRIAILTRGFEGCLFLFSNLGFEDVLGRLSTQPFQGHELRKMQRLFFANTHRGHLDASGRVLIPEKLKGAAQIDKDVVFVGVVDRVEIWAKARWEAYQQENDGEFDSLDAVLVEPDDRRFTQGTQGTQGLGL